MVCIVRGDIDAVYYKGVRIDGPPLDADINIGNFESSEEEQDDQQDSSV